MLAAAHAAYEGSLDIAGKMAIVDGEIADDHHSDNCSDENRDSHASHHSEPAPINQLYMAMVAGPCNRGEVGVKFRNPFVACRLIYRNSLSR